MSDTPKTDAILAGPDYDAMENRGVRAQKFAELCRQLERDLSEAIKALKECRNASDDTEIHAMIDDLMGRLGQINEDGTFK